MDNYDTTTDNGIITDNMATAADNNASAPVGYTYAYRYNRSFESRLIQANSELAAFYSGLKNLLLSFYKVKARTSWSCESFRIGRELVAKITLRGKYVRLFLALEPTALPFNTYHQRDKGGVKRYAEVPTMVKIKTQVGLHRAYRLIAMMMDAQKIPRIDHDYVHYLEDYIYANDNALVQRGLIKLVKTATLVEKPQGEFRRIVVRYRRSFAARLCQSEDKQKKYYELLANKLLSFYKVKDRVSWDYDSFHFGRIQLAKLTVRGKSVRLFLAINPNSIPKNTYHQKDKTDVKKYNLVPCMVKISGELSLNRAMRLIEHTMQLYKIPEVKDGEYLPLADNYPYATTEELIANGLIKELRTEEITTEPTEPMVILEEDVEEAEEEATEEEEQEEEEQEVEVESVEEQPVEEEIPEAEEQPEEQAEPTEEIVEQAVEVEEEPIQEVTEPIEEEQPVEEEPSAEKAQPEVEEEPIQEVVEPTEKEEQSIDEEQAEQPKELVEEVQPIEEIPEVEQPVEEVSETQSTQSDLEGMDLAVEQEVIPEQAKEPTEESTEQPIEEEQAEEPQPIEEEGNVAAKESTEGSSTPYSDLDLFDIDIEESSVQPVEVQEQAEVPTEEEQSVVEEQPTEQPAEEISETQSTQSDLEGMDLEVEQEVIPEKAEEPSAEEQPVEEEPSVEEESIQEVAEPSEEIAEQEEQPAEQPVEEISETQSTQSDLEGMDLDVEQEVIPEKAEEPSAEEQPEEQAEAEPTEEKPHKKQKQDELDGFDTEIDTTPIAIEHEPVAKPDDSQDLIGFDLSVEAMSVTLTRRKPESDGKVHVKGYWIRNRQGVLIRVDDEGEQIPFSIDDIKEAVDVPTEVKRKNQSQTAQPTVEEEVEKAQAELDKMFALGEDEIAKEEELAENYFDESQGAATENDISAYNAFELKLFDTSNLNKYLYTEVKNELLSYRKVRGKLTASGDVFRQGGSLLAKITLSGNQLKLHLALPPQEYNERKYNHYDMGNVKAYKDVPTTLDLDDSSVLQNAKQLIAETLAAHFLLYKNKKAEYVNYALLYTLKKDGEE